MKRVIAIMIVASLFVLGLPAFAFAGDWDFKDKKCDKKVIIIVVKKVDKEKKDFCDKKDHDWDKKDWSDWDMDKKDDCDKDKDKDHDLFFKKVKDDKDDRFFKKHRDRKFKFKKFHHKKCW